MSRASGRVPGRPYLLVAPLLGLALLFAVPTGAAARGIATADSAGGSAGPIGYDISYPQCGKAFPTNVAFAIVGVNGGRVYSANPCLGAGEQPSQLAWAGPLAALYANTGNPGPELSDYWPLDQEEPRPCRADDPDTIDCAYDYGWNAAADSFATAQAAFASLGWAEANGDEEEDTDAAGAPSANAWWLDVETANSWRSEPELNVAALQGAVDYLESEGVTAIGFYSSPRMWEAITGGTNAFDAYPSWVAGASTLREAQAVCRGEAFTGGTVAIAQYFANGFDANHPC